MKTRSGIRKAPVPLWFFSSWLSGLVGLGLLVIASAGYNHQAAAGPGLSANAQACMEKARQGCSANRWNDVIRYALQVLQEDPNHVEAQACLAIADLQQGRIQPAIQRLIWVNTANPRHPGYRLALAQALVSGGNPKEAEVQAGYAVQLAPQDRICREFLDRLTAASGKPRKNDGIVPPQDVGSHAPPPDAQERETAGSAKAENATASASRPDTAIPDKRWLALEEMCRISPDRALEILLKAILEEPDLLARQGWPYFQECTAGQQKSARLEIIRRFLRWKAGEIADREFEAWLPTAIPRDLWEQDVLLSSMIPSLRRGGMKLSFLNPVSKQEQEDAGWASSLDEQTSAALLNADVQEAWQLHVRHALGASADWHYQSARLALELWQASSFDDEWLLVARDHLLSCQSDGRWRDEARIILQEVERRCPKVSSR